MESIGNLVVAHLDAWNAPAGPDRDQSIATVYSPDVYVGEPGSAYQGYDGMNQAISGLQAQLPGTTITRAGPIQVAQDLVTYSWALGAPGQPPIASGRDVLLMGDNKIVRLYVLIDTP